MSVLLRQPDLLLHKIHQTCRCHADLRRKLIRQPPARAGTYLLSLRTFHARPFICNESRKNVELSTIYFPLYISLEHSRNLRGLCSWRRYSAVVVKGTNILKCGKVQETTSNNVVRSFGLYHPQCDRSDGPRAWHNFSAITDSSDASLADDSKQENEDESEIDTLIDNQSLYSDQYLRPLQGHRVLIIHPALKRSRFSNQTTAVGGVPGRQSVDHDLSESCALIEALPGWSVVHKEIVHIKLLHSTNVFTKGVFQEVLSMVRATKRKTAIFLDVAMLTGLQLKTLQRSWKVPVYDRYTIILQIFQLRAKTKEAKLQLALAEIPYYRSRLRGMHDGDLQQQRGGLHFVGGSGETWMDNRARILCDKEKSIQDKLSELRKRRRHQRQERMKRELPLVAVVGYTNAGKTSLIKSLTQSAALEPWDQLFATLDVTCHAGFLGNRMKVIFLDTVGFISNIPTNLVESFRSTLEDISVADILLHVRDASHPDAVAQKATVLQTLRSLDLKPSLLDTMIEVNNKSDLVTQYSEGGLYTSTVTGEGLPQLVHSLEGALIRETNRLLKRLKIPTAGPHLSWLYMEASVTTTRSCDTDSECILVDVIMTTVSYAKFCARFGKKKKKKIV